LLRRPSPDLLHQTLQRAAALTALMQAIAKALGFALRFEGAGFEFAHATLVRPHHVVMGMTADARQDLFAGTRAGERPADVPDRPVVFEVAQLVAGSGQSGLRLLQLQYGRAIVLGIRERVLQAPPAINVDLHVLLLFRGRQR
jgi:hypothetical protein